jgi:hypothetical protein
VQGAGSVGESPSFALQVLGAIAANAGNGHKHGNRLPALARRQKVSLGEAIEYAQAGNSQDGGKPGVLESICNDRNELREGRYGAACVHDG